MKKNVKRTIRWDRVFIVAAIVGSIVVNGLVYLAGPSAADLDACVAADRQIKAELQQNR